jgi:DNA-binding GntR family transcriptional regulator
MLFVGGRVPWLEPAKLQSGSLFSAVEREYGIEIAYANEEIFAIAADRPSAKLLHVTRDVRCSGFTS